MNEEVRGAAMPNIVIFTAPSLTAEEALEYLPTADIRPPAKRGDVTAAVATGAEIIVIIDGVFFQNESVGHKEILSGLKKGVKFFGSSSMGALRASEMEPFGMVGVGKIFEAYKSGRIVADDEVGLLYDPESGMALSDPMVNIRASFEKAVRDCIITADEEAALIKVCKSIYYPDRTYRRVVKESTLANEKKTELLSWLKTNAVDQKHEDAKACLTLVRELISDNDEIKE